MGRHKKSEDTTDPFTLGINDAAEWLQDAAEQIENWETEIAERKGYISEIFKEAGGRGFDTKLFRQALKEKKRMQLQPEAYSAEKAMLPRYLSALGIEIDDY